MSEDIASRIAYELDHPDLASIMRTQIRLASPNRQTPSGQEIKRILAAYAREFTAEPERRD